MSTVKPGDRVEFHFLDRDGAGEVVLAPTSTHVLVAVDPDGLTKGPHRFTLWCDLSAVVVIDKPKGEQT